MNSTQIIRGMAADDGVALHYYNDEIFCVVSSRPLAKAYEVDIINGDVKETEIIPIYLAEQN